MTRLTKVLTLMATLALLAVYAVYWWYVPPVTRRTLYRRWFTRPPRAHVSAGRQDLGGGLAIAPGTPESVLRQRLGQPFREVPLRNPLPEARGAVRRQYYRLDAGQSGVLSVIVDLDARGAVVAVRAVMPGSRREGVSP